MLSDDERRELALIEQGLGEDQGFAESFGDGARPRRRWAVWVAIAIGVLEVATGLLAESGGLLMQGLLTVGAVVLWLRWRARQVTKPPCRRW
jgi:hypothetical protein